MCDYSLHAFPNRLATEGEDLVSYRFGGSSIGLASPEDLRPVVRAREASARKFWPALKEWFLGRSEPCPAVAAVCVPPGARLFLRDIPKRLQRELAVGESEEVKFVEISADVNTYRDAFRFRNGAQVLLQALNEGQRVTVLSLELDEQREPIAIPGYAPDPLREV